MRERKQERERNRPTNSSKDREVYADAGVRFHPLRERMGRQGGGGGADRVAERVTGIQFRVRLGAGRRPPRPAPPKMLAKSLCESAATIRSVLAHLIHPTLACMPEPNVSESGWLCPLVGLFLVQAARSARFCSVDPMQKNAQQHWGPPWSMNTV